MNFKVEKINTTKIKIFRVSTTTYGLKILLKGQLKFLSSNNFDVYTAAAKGNPFFELNKTDGVTKHYNINIKRKISIFFDILTLIKLYIIFKKTKPTIVHSFTPKAGLISMIAAYLARVPIRIHTFTGLIFPYRKGLLKNLLLAMDKVTCKFSTDIIAEGKGVKKHLIEWNVSNKFVHIIANGNINGVSLDLYDKSKIKKIELNILKQKLKLEKESFVYLFVGRIVSEKGINELVEAFNIISLKNKNLKLLLVGHFEKKHDALKSNTIKVINENKSIILCGFQNDIRLFYCLADVFVLPSYREGFPNVILEAACFSLPIIASDISGCNELITNDTSGILVKTKSVNSIIKAMTNLYDNYDLRVKFGLNVRKEINLKYNSKYVWEETLKFYLKKLSI